VNHRIILHFDGGSSVQTEDELELEDGEDAEDFLTEYLQDRSTGVWKTLGHVTFIWNRLVAFSVEEI
jgi:hypothetical protein